MGLKEAPQLQLIHFDSLTVDVHLPQPLNQKHFIGIQLCLSVFIFRSIAASAHRRKLLSLNHDPLFGT